MKMPFDFRGRSLKNKSDFEGHDWDMLEDDYWEDFEALSGEDREEAEEEGETGFEHYAVDDDSQNYEALETEGETEEYAEEIVEAYEAEGYAEEAEQNYEEEAYAEEIGEGYQEEAYAEEEFDADSYVAELIEEEETYEAQEQYYEQDAEYYEEQEEEDVQEVVYVEEGQEEYYEEAEYEEDYENRPIMPFISASKIMDYLIIFGGVAVLLVALVLGGTYLGSRYAQGEEDGLKQVGAQLDNITMIGEQGLLAMSDAQKAMLQASQTPIATVTPEPSGYEENDYDIDVNVKLSLTSIEKDLKIKFLNSETGKLVGNVPFGVEVTRGDGKTTFWSDDDMDGIIYKTGLEAGNYTVKVQALTDEKYKTYGLPETEKKVEVKSQIVYEKVDVAAEIKDESQVDVQKEDTKQNDTIVEEYLQDTVTWVESTVTSETYEEVGKAYIPDPSTLALAGYFVRLAATDTTVTPPAEVPATEVPATEVPATEVPATEVPATEVPATEVPATEAPATEVPVATEVPSTPEPVPTVEPTETPASTATPEPSATPEASASPEPSMTPEPSATPEPTATPAPMVIKLDKKTETIYVGVPYELEFEVQNKLEDAEVKVESSRPNIVKAEVKNNVIVLTGFEEGASNITITCESDDFEATPVVCTIMVKMDPKTDKVSVLKDSQGREVYVYENNAYRQATYADYYTASKFYIRKEAKYTGWQTINGQLMYFDAAGKYVTGEQVIQGVKYNFSSQGTLVTGSGTMGIDVSKWNGTIDWTAVKNSGVSYVIIRVGYRGSSQGALIEDSKFRENIQGATRAGLKVGVYFFTQAVTNAEAVEEASMVLECIKDYNISYPVFLDVEPSGGRADALTKATRTEICKTFCETIKQYGYTPGIYANKTWLETKLDMNVLGNYKVWLAQYASEPTYQGRYDMWQYKDTGKVGGVSGDVDLNMSYLGY